MPRLISSNADQDVDIVPAFGRSLKINNSAAGVNTILDEDDMASDSAAALATQQSIKAYVDAQVGLDDNPTFETVTFSPTTGGIVGTTTNDNAAAGIVGEVTSSIVPSASAVSLTTATSANVTSISLTAGDWDVSGYVILTGTATDVAVSKGWLTLVSATQPEPSLDSSISGNAPAGAFATVGARFMGVSRAVIKLASTTTVYLGANSFFSGGTCTAYGALIARRMR